MPNNILTPRETLFCKAFLETGDAKSSYISAGYKGHDPKVAAYQLLDRPKVKEYLKFAKNQLRNKELASVEWKMQKLVGITERTEEEKPAVAISAISELNRMQGHYAPTQTQNLNINSDLDLDQLKEISSQIKDF